MNNTRAYIKKQLKKGVSEQDILEALKTSGHEPTAANKAIQETRKAIKRLHRIVVVLAALLAIAVVLLIATNYQAQTQENQPPTQTPTTPQEPAEQLTEQEIIIQAIQENNPALCEELQGDWREECEAEFSTAEEYTPTSEEEIIIQAIQENNPALCEELEDEHWREECYAEVQ